MQCNRLWLFATPNKNVPEGKRRFDSKRHKSQWLYLFDMRVTLQTNCTTAAHRTEHPYRSICLIKACGVNRRQTSVSSAPAPPISILYMHNSLHQSTCIIEHWSRGRYIRMGSIWDMVQKNITHCSLLWLFGDPWRQPRGRAIMALCCFQCWCWQQFDLPLEQQLQMIVGDGCGDVAMENTNGTAAVIRICYCCSSTTPQLNRQLFIQLWHSVARFFTIVITLVFVVR